MYVRKPVCVLKVVCVCERAPVCLCVHARALACGGGSGDWLLPGWHASRPVLLPPTGRALLSETKLAKVPRSGSRNAEAWLLPPAPAEPLRLGRAGGAGPEGSSRHSTARSPLRTSQPTPAGQNGPPCSHRAQHPAPELTGPPLQKGGSQDQGSGLGAPHPSPILSAGGGGAERSTPAPGLDPTPSRVQPVRHPVSGWQGCVLPGPSQA